ncbi:UDP-N-acetylenolpyruvoylglucosamine reductase [Endozoicomonas sp. (ex Bugula neritina AB1)]|nr:UDP-N-acetylenolpyruvoylglucosamine reductase [Endozoicomonas sp. (ex Bugula neritina AB1)]
MNSLLNIIEHAPLDQFNTFGLQAKARYFADIKTIDELRDALVFAHQKNLPVIPLGGGSNVVLTGDLDAVILAIHMLGRSELVNDGKQVLIKAGAGENWHEFVLWTLEQGAFGLENLSLIPGTVGAAPIQNIGAYGVELKDRFVSLEAVSMETGELVEFTFEDCAFGYRDSVFKQAKRDRYIIVTVTLQLDCQLEAKLQYGQLQSLLMSRLGDKAPTGLEISQAVCDIRQQKLPDPKNIGNAGSFFKNPVVTSEKLSMLRASYPDIVAYPVGGQWKLAAGWLIDQAGLRGFRQGDVGTYEHQALVLVNHGQATGAEVVAFSQFVQAKVNETFDVNLEPEPRFY